MVKWIWLAEIFGTGSIKTDELIDVFGSADGVYNATAAEYKKLRYLSRGDIEKLCNKSLDEAEKILDHCDKAGYHLINQDSDDYPQRFRDIHARPVLLYVEGELPDVDYLPSFSIVGTRKVTPYGAKVASMMAMGVAQAGGIVTSGMAEGTDTFAHKGALKGNGKTIAVLGNGLDVCYPRSNSALKKIIASNGCIISEYSPKTRPTKQSFPIRNRLIAALSEVTVVVEAGIRSGSLITATYAAEQGRTVYAVPGNIDRSESAGPNRLIIDGARPLVTVRQLIGETVPLYPHILKLSALENTSLLTEAKKVEAELLEEIKGHQRNLYKQEEKNQNIQQPLEGVEDAQPRGSQMPEGLSELQQRIYSLIAENSLNLNEIAAQCSEPVYRVVADVTALELKKAIELLPTGRFIIKD